MRKRIAIIVTILLLGAAAGIYVLWHNAAENHAIQNAQASDEAAISAVVAQFGAALKNVPLLAPKAVAAKAIQDNYAPFVSSDLLAAWKANPRLAPGRLTSSPWPKGIAVISISPNSDGSYDVQGKILEVTSADENLPNGSNESSALNDPIALLFRKIDGKWIITGTEEAVPRAQ